jgi:hypothetical protein
VICYVLAALRRIHQMSRETIMLRNRCGRSLAESELGKAQAQVPLELSSCPSVLVAAVC